MVGKLRRAWRALFPPERDLLLDQQDQFIAVLERITEHQTRQVEALGGAITAQANSFSQYLSLFKTTGTPETWTNRDEDELLSRKAAMTQAGMPADLSPIDQMMWVLDSSGR